MTKILALFVSLILITGNASRAADPAPGTQPEWVKFTVPAEGHKLLNEMVGTWKVSSKWWMKPDAKPETTEGTSNNKMIMDGRFLQQEVTGKAMGQPFTGMAITGHDNLKGTYQSIWIDSMSTSMATSTGTGDAKKKTLIESGTMSDPMTGMKDKPFRSETKIKGKNAFTMTMFSKDTTTGKEFKCAEMNYTRM